LRRFSGFKASEYRSGYFRYRGASGIICHSSEDERDERDLEFEDERDERDERDLKSEEISQRRGDR
jgi:hypothetical protein